MVADYANDAQERLLMDPLCPSEGWWGGSVTLNLTATIANRSAYVVTPREIARLIVMGICQQPVQIRNGFCQYLQFGRGLQPKGCQNSACASPFQAYERDNVVTLAPLLSTPQQVRIYPTDVRDAGKRVLLQGKDQNGMVILTTDPGTGQSAPGEYISLSFPFSTSVNQFSTITGIQKDQSYGLRSILPGGPGHWRGGRAIGDGPERGHGLVSALLGERYPEPEPLLRQPGNPLQITAQGRLDFVPVQNETDYLTIPNVPALLEEAQSIRFSKMENGVNQSAFHHARALQLLNGQIDAMEGKTSVAISVPISGRRDSAIVRVNHK